VRARATILGDASMPITRWLVARDGDRGMSGGNVPDLFMVRVSMLEIIEGGNRADRGEHITDRADRQLCPKIQHPRLTEASPGPHRLQRLPAGHVEVEAAFTDGTAIG
jgi:hypothetical protein